MRRYLLTLSTLSLCVLMPTAFAAVPLPATSVFEHMHAVEVPPLQFPTPVVVTLPIHEPYGVAVYETNVDGATQPQPWISSELASPITVTETSPVQGSAQSLLDGTLTQTVEFSLEQDLGSAYMIFTADKPITLDTMTLVLDRYVALPHHIAVSVQDGDAWKAVIARTKLTDTWINFPETTATVWKLELWHEQPLIMREIEMPTKEVRATGERIVWLARPGATYTLYADAQAYPDIDTPESGILDVNDPQIVTATLGDIQPNPDFSAPDYDKDGVPDQRDNCVHDANSDQADIDGSGAGDACDDHDRDGVHDARDNCPEHPNNAQSDADGDGIGDACDTTENRATERLPWLPWAAMGVTAVVVIAIIIRTIRSSQQGTPPEVS